VSVESKLLTNFKLSSAVFQLILSLSTYPETWVTISAHRIQNQDGDIALNTLTVMVHETIDLDMAEKMARTWATSIQAPMNLSLPQNIVANEGGTEVGDFLSNSNKSFVSSLPVSIYR
jgi:hypothetical protein